MTKNPGRPKALEAKKQYTVMLKPSVVEEIDKLAERFEMPRSLLMSNMIELGLDEAKVMEKNGLPEMYKIIMIVGKDARRLKAAFYKDRLDFIKDECEEK